LGKNNVQRGDIRGYHWEPRGILLQSKSLSSTSLAAKQYALGAYKKWDPVSARYAVGYHSVKSVIDTVFTSGVEYVYYLTP